jgi:hypothetical protein
VLSRVQTLAPNKFVEFYNFQRHQRNSLPKVLQGEIQTPSSTQEIETQGLETGSSSGQDTHKHLEKNDVSTQKANTTSPNSPSNQTKAQIEALSKKGQETPSSTPDRSATNTTRQQQSTKIGSPIQSVTPLQSSRGNPNAEVYIEDLTLISIEEMPPSDFFYSKKRRVVVKRETYQKEGEIVKRHRFLYDGHALGETKFVVEMTGTLGDFSTTNQCSVGNLAEQLKKKDLLVK